MPSNQYMNLSTPEPRPAQTEQVTVTPSASSDVKPRDKFKLILYKLGVTEVVLGSVIVVLWLASIVAAVTAPPYCYDSYGGGHGSCYRRHFSMTYASPGVWCGVFLFVSGGLGVAIRKNSSVCMYNANMAMSIISATMMAVLLIMASITAGGYEGYKYRPIRALHALLAIVGLCSMVVCIVHSAYCCAGTCCRRKQYYGTVMYSAPPQQYVQLPNGQLMLIQSQPMLQQNYPVTMMNAPMNFQQNQVPGAPMPVTMMPHASGANFQMNMPVMAAGSLPAGGQASVPQPVNASQAKQQEAEMQFYPSNPPSYNGHNA